MSEVVRKHTPPTIVEFGGKQRSSKVGWNHNLALEYMVQEAGRFIPLEEWCRFFYGKVNDDNRLRVRRMFTAVIRFALRNHRMLLVVEPTDARGTGGAIKIYDPTSQLEARLAQVKGERMRSRKELTDEDYQTYLQLSKPSHADPSAI